MCTWGKEWCTWMDVHMGLGMMYMDGCTHGAWGKRRDVHMGRLGGRNVRMEGYYVGQGMVYVEGCASGDEVMYMKGCTHRG